MPAHINARRTLTPRKMSAAFLAAGRVNWLYFQIASAVGNLGWTSQHAQLPDPGDDADLRAALTMLTRIDKRRLARLDAKREARENRKPIAAKLKEPPPADAPGGGS